MPLWEASFELDPPIEERTDNAAWQISRAARYRGTIYETDFDGTEREADFVRQQPFEEQLREAEKIDAAWPHSKPKPPTTKNTKGKRGK